jgi:alkylhydroperoxidase family enzyme
MQKHFNDREIVEITVLNAAENFYNLLNIPLEIEEDGLCAIQQGRKASAAA